MRYNNFQTINGTDGAELELSGDNLEKIKITL